MFGLPTSSDLDGAIVEAAVVRLRSWLERARSGLCARLDDLPTRLMAEVAERLHAECAGGLGGRANVRLLVSDTPATPWQCLWTEAVRLRNPDERGQKRPPLLLLVPPGTELLGSLDADTFNVLSCDDVVRDVINALTGQLPDDLMIVKDLLRGRDLRPPPTDIERARYLLAVAMNGQTREAAGLALCALGLWPHEGWMTTGGHTFWLTRNADVVARLKHGTTSLLDRVYTLGLASTDQARRLYQLVSQCDGVEQAAELVATDPTWRDLDLGQLEFAAQPTTVVVTLDPLDLPTQDDGYPIIRVREEPHLQLAWSAEPSPANVPSLTHYLVQLLPTAGDESEVAYASEAIAPGKSSRKSFRIKNLRALVEDGTLPEGLYRARVTAWSNATNITREARDGDREPSLSAPFWIQNTGEETEEPPARTRDQFVSSYMEARRAFQWLQLAAKRDPWTIPPVAKSWDKSPEDRAAHGVAAMKLGRQTYRVRISNLLRRIEAAILARPEELGVLVADLSRGAAPRDVLISARPDALRLSPADPFIAARTTLFAKIRGTDGRGTVETADLLELRGDIARYAEEYARLLRDAEREVGEDANRWPDRVDLAAIDTVRLKLPGLSDGAEVAVLLSPTHPLRLLWALQHALLGEAWLREAWARGSADSLTAGARQALQGGLQPTNVPPVLFDRKRVGYLQAGQLAPGWDVYLPTSTADKRSALARLRRATWCGSREAAESTRLIEIVDRVLRYLRMHPYVGQLQLNVFNPGDAGLVADLLLRLDREYPLLRYDVRLFSPEQALDDLGAALDGLVNPEVTIAEAAEKYSQSGRSALYPNLSYSKNTIEQFLKEPDAFRAHVSLLLDVFRPRIDVMPPIGDAGVVGLHGLVREETVRSHTADGFFAWERQLLPGRSQEIGPGDAEAGLLDAGVNALQRFAAALAASPGGSSDLLPAVRLDLSIGGQNLLFEVHRVSDWVLTLDRHLGIDYFDSAPGPDMAAPGILLDFSPEYPVSDLAVLMLTTRVDAEVDRLVAPALQRLGLEEPGASGKLIDWLRSLSGRLAMRLLAEPVASQGVVGMALARAFFAEIGMLEDSIVIPVDAHQLLLRGGVQEDADGSRTDLILARRVGTGRRIELSLVEVKCAAGHLLSGTFEALRGTIEGQVLATQASLAALFDPAARAPDAVDRALRNQTLARWLRFYVGRARRFRLLSPEAETALLALLRDLDAGYAVSFRQAGVVFELGREDDADDAGGAFTIHRVGRPTCERLLRGESSPDTPPPSWDRVRSSVRGAEVWTRRPEHDQGGGEGPSTDGGFGPRGDPDAGPRGGGAASEPPTELHEPRAAEASDVERPQDEPPDPICDVLVGDSKASPQWGVLGKHGSQTVGIDLNGTNTLSIFGVQGGGKSYTMGTVLEMALRPLPGLNVLPRPLAAVVFHYNESQDYAPEFVSMARGNAVLDEVRRLKEEYSAEPAGIADVLVLTPQDKVELRRREFPDLAVEPIGFHPAELGIQDWRFLMGAVGNDSLYIKELNLLMRVLRDDITVDGLRSGIEGSQLSESQKKLAQLRLRFAEQFVNNETYLRDKLRPGRLVVVDLRDELIEADEALGLFVVMLRVFAGATHQGRSFSKWIAFDEAHKYIRNADLVDSVVEVIRQMRHQATSVLIASQDPPSLPLKVMELSSLVMLHRMDSPGWLKHIQRAITALGDLGAPALSRLRPGEAYLWARSSTEPTLAHRAVKIACRPRATQHGGATRLATTDTASAD